MSRQRFSLNDLFNQSAIRQNDQLLDYIFTCSSSVFGITAGLLGLTGLYGFLFYLVNSVLFASAVSLLLQRRCSSTPNIAKAGSRTLEAVDDENEEDSSKPKFFTEKFHVMTSGHMNGICTFLLWWAFLYGLVHVY